PLIEPLKATLLKMSKQNGYSDLKQLSIISTNCFAGRIVQYLNIQYNSPTVGLYFFYPDYIEFLNNLKYYLTEARIRFVKESKYKLGNERYEAKNKSYPIGILGDNVEIHFLHYHSEKEAEEKWYRRAARVNFNNLFIIGMYQNLCTIGDINAFDTLPYKNKIMFSPKNINLASNEYCEEFIKTECVGDPYKKGDIFYKHLVSHFSKNEKV
ncbi:MAG: DUF1919 domain-containing protein, partial [Muribaculaceae bacterium]|nr:DUF1919 domain-containing protein [Muribaculaceae bacterium]